MQSNSSEALVFFHFSDIHFCKETSTGTYDLDEDIRNEVEIDAAELAKELGATNGILVSGDIAFAGKRAEYKIARSWLNRICNIVNCSSANIMVTPGNHDVDRGMIEHDQVISLLHKEFRTCPVDEIDHLIQRVMQNPDTRDILYRPIKTYLARFASFYGCEIDAQRPYWERDFNLNDGSILRFRGINSALISDRYDDEAVNKLVVGGAQATLQRQSGVTYATLCHHPPTWLREQDTLEDLWNARVALQLFGHKHRNRIRQQDNKTLILTAGATHPDRREKSWQPFYSAFKLWVTKRGDNRELVIQVFPRIWDLQTNAFVPWYTDKGEPNRQYHLPLVPWVDPDKPKQKPIQVFVADDFFATREGLCTAIKTLDGFEVVEETGEKAKIYALVKQFSPDILIIDLKWNNDETAGESVIAEIKPNFPDIKIIAITAHENLIERARQAGADAALTKTFSKQNIADVLVKLSQIGPKSPDT